MRERSSRARKMGSAGSRLPWIRRQPIAGRVGSLGAVRLPIVINTPDWIIDLGPEGGEAGGQIVAQGPPETVARCPASHTGQYLTQTLARF